VLAGGAEYEAALEFYRQRGSTSAKPHIVLVEVAHAAPLISPAYDTGQSEAEISATWRSYWEDLWNRRQT
jgi:hypothetical protein